MTDEQIKALWLRVTGFLADGDPADIIGFARALLADGGKGEAVHQVRRRNGEEWTVVSEAQYKICGGAGYAQRILYAAPQAESAPREKQNVMNIPLDAAATMADYAPQAEHVDGGKGEAVALWAAFAPEGNLLAHSKLRPGLSDILNWEPLYRTAPQAEHVDGGKGEAVYQESVWNDEYGYWYWDDVDETKYNKILEKDGPEHCRILYTAPQAECAPREAQPVGWAIREKHFPDRLVFSHETGEEPSEDDRDCLTKQGHAYVPLYAAPTPERAPHKIYEIYPAHAKQRYDECDGDKDLHDSVERLRFFCSLAMNGQDWIDGEPFFDAVIAERAQESAGVSDEWLFEKLSEIADEEIMKRNPKSIIDVGRQILAANKT